MAKGRGVTKEVDLSDRKAVRDFLESRPPEDKLRDMVETHIHQNDALLLAILDVTAAGWHSENPDENQVRFHTIEELLGQYRKRNDKFIDTVYAFSKKVKAA